MRLRRLSLLGFVSTSTSLLLVSGNAFASGDAPAPAPSQNAPAESVPAQSTSAVSPSDSVSEVQALVDAGKFVDAEKKATELTQKDPSNAEAFNLLGFSLRKQSKWKPSIDAYKKALKIKPDYAQAKEYLAVAYLNTGAVKPAKKLHAELAKSNPDLAKMVETEAKRLKVKW